MKLLVAFSFLTFFALSADGCDVSISVSKSSKLVTSPNYPDKYPPRQNCITSLSTAGPLFCLKFTLQYLEVESSTGCKYDNVEVKCGNEVVQMYCGQLSSVAGIRRVVKCQKSFGEIKFTSDSTVNGNGFAILANQEVCAGYDERSLYLTEKQGEITSPNYPLHYPPNLNYLVHICLPPDCQINLRFTDFEVEHHESCSYDYVSVYRGNSLDTSNRISKLCHSRQIPDAIRIGSEALVHFRTDNSVERKGFKLQYNSVCSSPCRPNPCANGGTCQEKDSGSSFECCCPSGYTGSRCDERMKAVHPLSGSGCVRSPNFPRPYPNNELSDFIISANDGESVYALFHDFSVENSGNCSRDRLEIYDGNSACRSQLLGVFCGNVLPSLIQSSSENLLLRFVSDSDEGASGFHFCYSSDPGHAYLRQSTCSNNGDCQHICTPLEAGGRQCSCRPGFKLNDDGKTCRDIDECNPRTSPLLRHNCIHPAVCENTIGSFYCRCDREGYRLNSIGNACEDENECTNPSIHHCEQNCTNTIGSYYCECRDGFLLSSNQKQCTDINECSINRGGCSQLCKNFPGSYECGCQRGYAVNPDNTFECIDVDECRNFSARSKRCRECRQTDDGWYACNCEEGYTTDPHGYDGCIDIDECKLVPDICGKGTCRNLPGRFECNCQTGFQSPRSARKTKNMKCTDINECETNNGGCYGNCTNTDGSFQCSCPAGYQLAEDGKNCVDTNECLDGSAECQHTCINTNGSYECSCNSGYYLANNSYSCVDINECSAGDHYCSDLCVNYPGSYQCACYPGYALGPDRSQCIDINECQTNNGGCQQQCINTPGNYTCRCESGYTSTDRNVTCQDVNECLENPCNMTCQNTNGSFSCGCPEPRFVLDSNEIDCLDFDECAVDNGGCNHICVNTYGGFHCSCYSGYKLKHNTFECKDVNECKMENRCSHHCHNMLGSYYCSCPRGFELSDDNVTCIDINECARNISQCSQICSNEVGSFSCSCLTGYVVNEQNSNQCDDINECAENNGNCSGECENLNGSYRCSCKDNEKLDKDGHTCLTCPTCTDFMRLEEKLQMLENRTTNRINELTNQVMQLERQLQRLANRTYPPKA